MKVQNTGKDRLFYLFKCNEYCKSVAMMIVHIQTDQYLCQWTPLQMEMMIGYRLNPVVIKDQILYRNSEKKLDLLFLLILFRHHLHFTMRCYLILCLIILLHALIVELVFTSITFRYHHHHKVKKNGNL